MSVYNSAMGGGIAPHLRSALQWKKRKRGRNNKPEPRSWKKRCLKKKSRKEIPNDEIRKRKMCAPGSGWKAGRDSEAKTRKESAGKGRKGKTIAQIGRPDGKKKLKVRFRTKSVKRKKTSKKKPAEWEKKKKRPTEKTESRNVKGKGPGGGGSKRGSTS